MTHSLALGRTRSKFDETQVPGFGIFRTGALGLGTSYGAAQITCGTDEVLLIDEVEIYGLTPDSSANVTAFLKVNDIEMRFHFPGLVNQRKNDQMVWRPKGNLMVRPGQTLTAKASAANTIHMHVRYRRMQLSKAIMLAEVQGGLTNVCSTDTVAGSGTSAATAKAILTGVAGYHVEVLGFTLTGHNYNAAVDSIRLGFWDGTTGTTFASGGKTIFKGYACGADREYSPRLLIGDTRGCIQGPTGWGLYIQASTNLAGATPTADFNVIYRLVKTQTKLHNMQLATSLGSAVTSVVVDKIPQDIAQTGTLSITLNSGSVYDATYTAYVASTKTFTIDSHDFTATPATAGVRVYVNTPLYDVATPTGAVGVNPQNLKKWWVVDEALPAADGATTGHYFFGSAAGAATLRLRGHAGSAICDTHATYAAVSIGVGADYTLPLVPYVFMNDDGNTAECSRTWGRDDTAIWMATSQSPGFIGIDVSTKMLNRCQLAWGTFDAETFYNGSTITKTFA